jgi:hypothetical protein
MNILHFLNVLIGFSLIMLILSIVTSSAAQVFLVLLNTKARAVGNGLTGMLEEIGLDKDMARLNVNALLDKVNRNTLTAQKNESASSATEKEKKPADGENQPNSSKPIKYLGNKSAGSSRKMIVQFLARAPKNIGREEFLLLLLRKAKSEDTLARKFNFDDAKDAEKKLEKLEISMLHEEANNPALPAQVWRTKAMQKIVPELASKIFARFDEVMDRVTEDVSWWGKSFGIIITVPLLLLYWPVDSMDLFNLLYNDQVLSEKLAGIAETNVPVLKTAQKELQECKKDNPDNMEECKEKKQALEKLANNMTADLSSVAGLFGKNLDGDNSIQFCLSNKVARFLGKNSDEKNSDPCVDFRIAKPTPGIFVTWILVSLGSAFWLGLLNKMLGIRSEFSKKLDAQRELRATSQE